MLNPVVTREITERLRGLRAFVALSAFVLLLTLTAFLVFEGSQAASSAFDIGARTRSGRLVFESVVLIMTVLVLFFVPALCAGAIAGERERQTLATLQVTLLRPRAILVGKVVAALAYLVLLIVAALPVLGVAYVLGGLRVVDIGRAVLAVALMALLLAAVVVAVSTFARRVQTATVLAYGVTALLVIAGPLAFTVGEVLDARSDGDHQAAPAALLAASPVVLVADLASGNVTEGDGPLSSIRTGLLDAKERNGGSWFALFPDAPGEGAGDVGDQRRPDGGVPAWLLSSLVMAALAAALFLAAARRLRTPADTER